MTSGSLQKFFSNIYLVPVRKQFHLFSTHSHQQYQQYEKQKSQSLQHLCSPSEAALAQHRHNLSYSIKDFPLSLQMESFP